MILYTVTGTADNEGFLDVAKSGDLTGKNIYVNMTNRCPCNCVFCLRQTKELMEGSNLWLGGKEPTVEEVLAEFEQVDLTVISEVVFCGYGEPTERFEDLCSVIDGLKERCPDLKVRINTAGLGNLIWGKDITPQLEGRVDTISISLNAPDAEEYLALTRSKFGIGSYDALKEFAVLAKRYVPHVVLSVVDQVMSKEKIAICQQICDELGVTLRVRPYDG